MNRSLLDTDILSYILDQRYPEVDETAKQYIRVYRHFSVSSATISEVVRGFQKDGNFAAKEHFLELAENFEVVTFGFAESVLAGEIMGSLQRSGKKIGLLDPFIAATAIVSQFELVTNNTRHYNRIVELGYPLKLVNWRQV